MSSTIPKVVAFASHSFTSPFTVFSGLRPTQEEEEEEEEEEFFNHYKNDLERHAHTQQ